MSRSGGGSGGLPRAFDEHHAAHYGAARWATLRAALEKPTRHVAVLNSFGDGAAADGAPVSFAPRGLQVLWRPDGEAFPAPRTARPNESALQSAATTTIRAKTESQGVQSHYLLDAASLVPVAALDSQPGHVVLDLCAAPGGKSFALSQLLFSDPGPLRAASRLVSNEPNEARYRRLSTVLHTYLPASLTAPAGSSSVPSSPFSLANRVSIVSFNGERLPPAYRGKFDRVIVDAPCSSDRHLIHERASARWSLADVRAVAATQERLLRQAFEAVKPSGGLVVYSTCALSREENDGVVGNVLARHPAALGVIERSPFSDAQMAIGEPTEHGRIILPDHVMGECGSGWGPIYWTVLRRRPRQGDDDDDDDDE